jgi:hypothetical protein
MFTEYTNSLELVLDHITERIHILNANTTPLAPLSKRPAISTDLCTERMAALQWIGKG